jgi:DNA-binding PadR family transcriptional regulator
MSSILPSKDSKLTKNSEKQPVQYFILKAVSIGKRMKITDVVSQIEDTITKKEKIDRKVKPAYTIQRTIKKLHNDGLLAIELEESSEYIKLTENGFDKLRDQMLISKDSVVPLSGWDGHYCVVILTTKDKNIREKLRYALTRAQFENIAPGVFITKLNMEHLIIQLKALHQDSFVSFKTEIKSFKKQNYLQFCTKVGLTTWSLNVTPDSMYTYD